MHCVKGTSEPRVRESTQAWASVLRHGRVAFIYSTTLDVLSLIHNALVYEVDIYQWLYVSDLATGKMLYRKETELEGFTHYNAVAVAASPTLVGKHVMICDNQGTTLVLEPGPTYKVVVRNRIGTVIDRPWPIPSQETLTYSPPIADAGRLYLRGEAYLYCIGEK
jgi:hypothetical protein